MGNDNERDKIDRLLDQLNAARRQVGLLPIGTGRLRRRLRRQRQANKNRRARP